MIKIKEVIVVEGICDEIAVKRGINAEVIYVSGFGISNRTMNLIKNAQERCGVILLMDSDSAGERIRKKIANEVKGVKHAYIPKSKSIKNGDIGVENARPEDIVLAIKNAKCELSYKREEFTQKDLFNNKLVGNKDSLKRREIMGNILGIGTVNAKKFLSRLNSFNISREMFLYSLKKLEELIDGEY